MAQEIGLIGLGIMGRPMARNWMKAGHSLTVYDIVLLTLSPRTLEALRLRGGGPPFILVTDRAVRYRREDLWQWISTRRRTSTSDTSGYT